MKSFSLLIQTSIEPTIEPLINSLTKSYRIIGAQEVRRTASRGIRENHGSPQFLISANDGATLIDFRFLFVAWRPFQHGKLF